MSKTALITGASRGIGKAIAIEFAQAGYDLYLVSLHSSSLLQSLKKELESDYSISCNIFTADVGNYNDVSSLYTTIPKLDVLINNAGISYIGLLSEMDVASWNQVMNTNINSIFYMCKYAIPIMLNAQHGRIINISSVWGNVGASMEVAYSTSKGALNAFTKALSKELAPSNIQVNAIACGVIDTDMNRCFTSEELAFLRDDIPADRFGDSEEVGKFALQLAESPSYLTGQIINLDGGWI